MTARAGQPLPTAGSATTPTSAQPPEGPAPRRVEIRELAIRAEDLGADTAWLADEILWRVADWPEPVGWWDCLTMLGARGSQHVDGRRAGKLAPVYEALT